MNVETAAGTIFLPRYITVAKTARRLGLRYSVAYDRLWEAEADFRRNHEGVVTVAETDVDALASIA